MRYSLGHHSGIETVEILLRAMEVKEQELEIPTCLDRSYHDAMAAAAAEEVSDNEEVEAMDCEEKGANADSVLGKRKAEGEEERGEKAEEAPQRKRRRPLPQKKRRRKYYTARPFPNANGHTGYLTFARKPVQNMRDDA